MKPLAIVLGLSCFLAPLPAYGQLAPAGDIILPERKPKPTLKQIREQTRYWMQRLENLLTGTHPSFKRAPGLEAIYTVEADGTIRLEEGTAKKSHQSVWGSTRRVLEATQTLATVKRFAVFRSKRSDVAAFVQNASLWSRDWGVAVNAAHTARNADLVEVLIHEAGHLFTLNTLTYKLNKIGCLTSVSDDTSDLAKFAETFWQHCSRSRRKRFSKWSFATPHAALNVSEDIASSFTSFVLCGQPRRSWKAVVWQKKRFFWARPRYVALRQQIRTALGRRAINRARSRHGYHCSPSRYVWKTR